MNNFSGGDAARYYAVIAGTGSEVPCRELSNDDLAKMVETSDDWITTRTGIKTRRIADSGQTTASLSAQAARKALETAGCEASDIEMIVLATITPEMVFPSTACFVQDAIGAKKAWAFDLAAACSGFVYALSVAEQFITTGRYKNALVIGAETLSKITDYSDRTSCILFGDGAGAVVLRQSNQAGKGIIYSTMSSDGSGWTSLNCQAYGSKYPASKPLEDPRKMYMQINGREVYQLAVRRIVDTVNECLEKCGIAMSDVDLLVSHQMNARIIESAAKRLEIPDSKVFLNIDRYGNTSAASIPIALDECVRGGRIKPGDTVILVTFGAGLTWGANVIKF
jgi:3-oxoacyl-[acyl-carrier-protein] synthase-3